MLSKIDNFDGRSKREVVLVPTTILKMDGNTYGVFECTITCSNNVQIVTDRRSFDAGGPQLSLLSLVISYEVEQEPALSTLASSGKVIIPAIKISSYTRLMSRTSKLAEISIVNATMVRMSEIYWSRNSNNKRQGNEMPFLSTMDQYFEDETQDVSKGMFMQIEFKCDKIEFDIREFNIFGLPSGSSQSEIDLHNEKLFKKIDT